MLQGHRIVYRMAPLHVLTTISLPVLFIDAITALNLGLDPDFLGVTDR